MMSLTWRLGSHVYSSSLIRERGKGGGGYGWEELHEPQCETLFTLTFSFWFHIANKISILGVSFSFFVSFLRLCNEWWNNEEKKTLSTGECTYISNLIKVQVTNTQIGSVCHCQLKLKLWIEFNWVINISYMSWYELWLISNVRLSERVGVNSDSSRMWWQYIFYLLYIHQFYHSWYCWFHRVWSDARNHHTMLFWIHITPL